MAVLPMFPLGTVLFPGAALPLHVFEPRYQALVRRCLEPDTEPEFGVVLIERGSEVGGGDVRRDVGTVARIVQLAELGGGRYALVALGTRRVRVEAWLPDDPYPRAEVAAWDDPPADDDAVHDTLARTVARLRRTLAFATESGAAVASATSEVSVEPVLASYQAAALAPIGPADGYRLLAADGAAERFVLLDEMLADVDGALRFRLGVGPDHEGG